MRLTALQLPAAFGEPAAQLDRATGLLDAGPTDLVLFSEAALTGYVSERGSFDLRAFAEPLEGPTTQALATLARRFDCLVVGPVIEADGTRCFNAMVGVAPDGSRVCHYRKRHPWFPETWATAGDAPHPCFAWRGHTFTLAICFDVHFLAAEAASALRRSEVLLFASAWVDDEGDARPALLGDLVRTHGCSVLNANWGLGTPPVHGQGGSMFVSSTGEPGPRLGPAGGRLDVTV